MEYAADYEDAYDEQVYEKYLDKLEEEYESTSFLNP